MIDTSDAQPSDPIYAIPPYRVVSYLDLHTIHNARGVNCLSFRSKPGAVFTRSREYADAICADWNNVTNINLRER